ncbi:MAG: hypothetical protein DRP67_01075 [Candidatus Omnitrophota bacterium]|nr:MAG: hypothetical protein DRP67_01075 [Candidatus Omnitrophota bacterium]
MKIKSSYILKEYSINFLFALFIFIFIFSLEGLFRIVELLIQGSLSFISILKLFSISIIVMLPYIIPLVFLYSSMSLFTRLSSDREITIFSISGINPFSLFKIILLISLSGCLLLYYFNFYLSPKSKFERRNLIYNLKFKNPLNLLKEGVVLKDIPGATIYIRKIEKNLLKDIAITYSSDDGMVNFIKAKEGKAKYSWRKNCIFFFLKDGHLITYIPGEVKNLVKLEFKTYRFSLPLSENYKVRNLKKKITEKTLPELKSSGMEFDEIVEINKRSLFASLPFLFSLFGFVIGVKIKQKGKILHIGLGAIISIFFYEMLTVGEILAVKTKFGGFIWFPFFVFLIITWIFWKWR